jgi:hypothetical protein
MSLDSAGIWSTMAAVVRTIIRIEGLLFFILGLVVYLQLGGNILFFVLFLLAPDISMIGYRKNAKVGSQVYNLVHNYAAGIIIFALGLVVGNNLIGFAGLIIFAHVGMDHAFGFGLKYPEGFKKTHLQEI